MEGKIKAPPLAWRMWLVGLVIFGIQTVRTAGASAPNINDFNAPSAISEIGRGAPSHDDG